MKKLVLALLVLAAIAGAAYWFVHKGGSAKKPETAAPKVDAKVERRTIRTSVDVAGDVKPEKQVEVKPEISARILKIYVEEGSKVKAGDVLVDLDATELTTQKSAAETEIAIANLELQSAQRVLDRKTKLRASNLVTEEGFEDAQTALEVAEKKLLRSKQQLDNILSKLSKTQILAPLDGTVLSLPVVEGQVVVGAGSVNAGTVLMTIADLGRLVIECHVNQIDVAKIAPGMPFEFTVDSVENVKMKGEIATVAPISTLKNNVKGFSVNLRILEPDQRLRPGMTADVTIPTGKAEDVVCVPVTAVFVNGGKKTAYVKSPSGTPDEREISVGLVNVEFAEVKSGLREGETVYLVRPEHLPKS